MVVRIDFTQRVHWVATAVQLLTFSLLFFIIGRTVSADTAGGDVHTQRRQALRNGLIGAMSTIASYLRSVLVFYLCRIHWFLSAQCAIGAGFTGSCMTGMLLVQNSLVPVCSVCYWCRIHWFLSGWCAIGAESTGSCMTDV